MKARSRSRALLLGVLGALVLVVVAELAGRLSLLGPRWPGLVEVFSLYGLEREGSLLWRSFGATAAAALGGLALGCSVALASAIIAGSFRALGPGVDRIAAILNAVPSIAIAPVLVNTIGAQATPVITASLSAGFLMFVAVTSGLRLSGRVQNDVFTVMGASSGARLVRLRLPASVPSIADGITMAAPAAVLGATLGEWFGAPRGLGLLVISSLQNFQMSLLWAAALTATLFALVLFLLGRLIQVVVHRRFA